MENVFSKLGKDMGMYPVSDTLHGCGTQLIGDERITSGYLWYFPYQKYCLITKCDFVFLQDCKVTMPEKMLYIALRLDQANHLPPGKVVSYMEDLGNPVRAAMKKGCRITYTELLYLPVFYKKHLTISSSGSANNPVDILKQMGREHNWPNEMLRILLDVNKCCLKGPAAELFFAAKSYELMSALLEMGNRRILKNEGDYDKIVEVIEYINQNIHRTIRQKELLKIANTSATKLKNVFKHFTGQTITDYIAAAKSDKAAHLLAETDKNIVEISHLLGYETPTGFTTFFKKQTGISPSEYRRQMSFHCLKNPSMTEELTLQNLIQ